MDTRYKRVEWGKGKPRMRTSNDNWKMPIKWDREAAKNGTRPRVFCASLSDWLDDEVPIEWLADLLDLIRKTPNLDWLLLTKRPENFHLRLTEIVKEMGTHMTLEESFLRTFILMMRDGRVGITYTAPECGQENYWIGTSVENQDVADKRIPELLQIPARVRFLSCEPLLGNLNLDRWFREFVMPPIDWCICGGESGPKARPMHPDWARSLRDQCKDAGVPFLFKQWGEWLPYGQGLAYLDSFRDSTLVGNGPGPTGVPSYFVGKKAAGRLLDDVEHNEYPKGHQP
jgi:protein gp37